MKFLKWVWWVLLLQAAGVQAADNTGSFALKGAGFLPCKVYIAEREKRSNIYYLIGGWMEGFISAHNKHALDTYDILSFESLELLLRVVGTHCANNPEDRLYSVLNTMLVKLQPSRVRRESERVEITEGERKTVLYRETIRRMQIRLTKLGLYKGEVDSRFTDATRSALIAFQSDIGFKTTGFPDQATLWRLLR